ncbi:AP-3 complex subunit delta [Fusarium oxysporum f. sp. lycopersici 4287]|uniref:AP-3 complex subunit delta n=1 Tax=Fusarium oxysporum f. sp. lycopersici (strain 4287 / CBS 123668 / FGSC 9935 / NRRL 34936) TaxID=426428 RepID=A0A0J9UAV0_FUSO4|nr:AP-3 complex subunit delta [Fusarium oxysporum f. sp. lycopersici 4287]KNA96154.1 AP-3 complex subunit delta [Fusarium oxysporum f. sp. lycopersici 4287]
MLFEKSLYDLIRGLRNHKGNEKEYIQKSLKECRAEVRSQDMDLKATALLKLIYLEMVGHDMSWASFHVLEVMSSPKYHQKRVGYLGAVQSFRPDTEVLMLATNLLKKDLGSTTPTVISLPIATLPHVITPSLALSTLQDLLPRLSHSHSNIRKKTLVTLYRLALVYPEALRAAWPKIKERLMDPDEDPSVTAAIVNVVCELGWRRPNDFLPLAPRLFELLVDGGNNWMAIKLIKLFATLTPLEPRLVRKLLPPLTNIIRTTPAMSLLYECINGIIQGGILGNSDDSGTDEIATLCVNKLRGMVMIDGDPNLKYVALLAFNKIVTTHPYLVSQQEDVILECIDSPDITIRIQALDLVQGMVTGDNLVSIDNYSSVLDFDWYIDVLTQLVRMAPASRKVDDDLGPVEKARANVSEKIGDELRNVAVKVRVMRSTAVRAAEIILSQLNTDTPPGYKITSGALKSVAWIMGEYASQLAVPDEGLNGLLQLIPRTNNPEVLTTTLQAVTKVFATIVGDESEPWTAERKSRVSLLMARIIHVFEPLALHPSLEVQERAVEFTELLKLTAEAASSQPASTDDVEQDPPLLLTQAIPSLFNGWELNSVSKGAQLNVPVPVGLDLDEPIHANLAKLLSEADSITLATDDSDEFETYYHQKPPPTSIDSSAPAISRIAEPTEEYSTSYQQADEDTYLDADIVARRKAERLERNRDDPFYIPSNDTPRTSTPIHNILQSSNGPDLDIDSIPIMQLELSRAGTPAAQPPRPQPKPRQKVVIAADETLEGSASGGLRSYDSENNSDSFTKSKARKTKTKQGLLGVDSSGIGSFSLEGQPSTGFDYEQQQREDVEMQQAMKEVERLRLEMQRANERIQVAQGVDVEGTVVKKKKKKPKKDAGAEGAEGEEVKPKKKKKKAPRAAVLEEEGGDDSSARGVESPASGGEVAVAKKKKKKKRVAEIQDE